jgi:hypothetical protein
MAKIIAYCGLICSECDAFIATARNDQALRKKVAARWTEEYHHPMKPEDINCVGCTSVKGAHIGYCSLCEIRTCGLKHKVSTCASCPEYACEKLTKFFAMAPAAKSTLEGLRSRTSS